MELGDYVRVARERWLAMILLVVVGGLAGFCWSAIQPRVYSADATAIIRTGVSTDLGSALVGDNYAKSRVKSYLNIASSRAVAQYVIDELGLTATPEELIAGVTVDNPADTAVLEIQARGSTPVLARDTAEAWIGGMVQQVRLLENGETTPSADEQSIVQLQTLDTAVLPTEPTSPNTRLALLIGLLSGLAAGIAYAVVRNSLDRRIRSSESVQEATGLAVVGSIPFDKNLDDEHRLVASAETTGARDIDDVAVAEAMRELRTNLQFMDVDNPPRIIVITSSLPGDGKSTIAANLAVTIAASGQNVVVVDGDLRRPMVATSFNLLPGVGLTDVLVGRAEIQDVLQPWGETGLLHVMGAGSVPPNPSELLGSQAMHALLTELAKTALVLVDAPPLLPVTDAAILTARADGALIVASVGKSRIEALEKSLQNLAKVKGRPLGVILNRVPRRGPGSARYDYQSAGYYSVAPVQSEQDSKPTREPESIQVEPTPLAPHPSVPRPTAPETRRSRRAAPVVYSSPQPDGDGEDSRPGRPR